MTRSLPPLFVLALFVCLCVCAGPARADEIADQLVSQQLGLDETGKLDSQASVHWAQMWGDPEVLQATMSQPSVGMDREMDSIMEEARLDDLLDPIIEDALSRPDVVAGIQNLASPQEAQNNFMQGMNYSTLAFMGSLVGLLQSNPQVTEDVEGFLKSLDMAPLLRGLHRQLMADQEVRAAMKELDDSRLSLEQARANLANSTYFSGLFQQRNQVEKNLILKMFSDPKLNQDLDAYFSRLLRQPQVRRQMVDFLRQVYASPDTKPIWVDIFATVVLEPTSPLIPQYAQKLSSTPFIRDGVLKAAVFLFQDPAYHKLVMHHMEMAFTQGAVYSFYKKLTLDALLVAAGKK